MRTTDLRDIDLIEVGFSERLERPDVLLVVRATRHRVPRHLLGDQGACLLEVARARQDLGQLAGQAGRRPQPMSDVDRALLVGRPAHLVAALHRLAGAPTVAKALQQVMVGLGGDDSVADSAGEFRRFRAESRHIRGWRCLRAGIDAGVLDAVVLTVVRHIVADP